MRLRLCRSRRSRKLPVRCLGSPVARFARTVGAAAYQAAAYQLPLRDAARSSSYAEGTRSSLRAAGNPTCLADEAHFHWRARSCTFVDVRVGAASCSALGAMLQPGLPAAAGVVACDRPRRRLATRATDFDASLLKPCCLAHWRTMPAAVRFSESVAAAEPPTCRSARSRRRYSHSSMWPK